LNPVYAQDTSDRFQKLGDKKGTLVKKLVMETQGVTKILKPLTGPLAGEIFEAYFLTSA